MCWSLELTSCPPKGSFHSTKHCSRGHASGCQAAPEGFLYSETGMWLHIISNAGLCLHGQTEPWMKGTNSFLLSAARHTRDIWQIPSAMLPSSPGTTCYSTDFSSPSKERQQSSNCRKGTKPTFYFLAKIFWTGLL